MPEIRFADRPVDGICRSTSDGAYIHRIDNSAQLIVVGPMLLAPADYEVALSDHLKCGAKIVTAEFMKPENPIYEREVYTRGFVSMIFRLSPQ